jgi:FkbM family methyltransferase
MKTCEKQSTPAEKSGTTKARALVKETLRRVVSLSRRGPHGLVRIGICFFEVFPETRDLMLTGYYENEEREAIKRYLSSDLPVIELGGSQGIVACITNRVLKVKTSHIVVEANPNVIPLLARNRDRNGCKFEVVHGAVGPPGETITFFCNDNPLKSSTQISKMQSCEVPSVSLSELARSRGFRDCTLICDIEGAEIALIERELETLADRFRLLIIEFHPTITGSPEVQRNLDQLAKHGFTLIWKKRHVHVLRK